METMRALVKEGPCVSVREVPRPVIRQADDVLIRVSRAGICRTDLYVARGSLPARDPLILGHEFAGTVEDLGSAVDDLEPGERVAVMPALPCGRCATCAAHEEHNCPNRTFLGIEHHGAFADFVRVPAAATYPVSDSLSFEKAAYAEPVAAALAVLSADLDPEARGVIYGTNRIATLTQRLLVMHGFRDVSVHDPSQGGVLPDSAFEFAVESIATTEAFKEIIRAVRPLGTIILKSRACEPVSFHMTSLIQKRLTLRAVNYRPFEEAISLLAENRVDVSDLLGQTHELEDFEFVMAESAKESAPKLFFRLGDA